MADYRTTDTALTAVADAIREKGGTSASLVYPAGFISAINNISGGGATITDTTDSHGGTIRSIDTENATTIEPLSVTQNGTYTAITGKAYSPVTVNVSGGGSGGYTKFAKFEADGSGIFVFSSGDTITTSEFSDNSICFGCFRAQDYDTYNVFYLPNMLGYLTAFYTNLSAGAIETMVDSIDYDGEFIIPAMVAQEGVLYVIIP